MPVPCIPNGLRVGRQPFLTAIRSQRRAYNVAVVGGGITGLTAAWKLTQDSKCNEITLYEKSHRLGGWMESETIPVDGGKVVFEYGPRTLRWSRPAAQSILEMANAIGLSDQIIFTMKTQSAALNRYIYYPDHLVRLPTPTPELGFLQNISNMIGSLFQEPLLKPLLPALLFEHTKPARMPDDWQRDESISSFISRRFNPQVADNLVSAMMHGIYAGDIDKLSAQTLLGPLRNMEDTGILYGMIMKAWTRTQNFMVDDSLVAAEKDQNGIEGFNETLIALTALGDQSSTFTFPGGTQQLPDALASALKKSGKVNIRTEADIQAISHQPGDYSPMNVTTSEDRKAYDHVIATIPAPALTKLLSVSPKSTNHPDNGNRVSAKLPSDTIQQLKSFNYATTAMVVNLYYPDPDLLPVKGFGYLIPRSIPASENPECGLGVIFGTESAYGSKLAGSKHVGPGEDDHQWASEPASQDTVDGTKLTVMMGGHYWDHYKPSDYPDHETAVRMACSMLERHLGITAKPTVTRSRLQRDAIPQYTVGHLDRVYELSKTVKRDFDQKLVLAGNWYNGVGVGDCIKQGLMAATYGVGFKPPSRVQLGPDPRKRGPHTAFDYESWDLQGGVPTAPVRIVELQADRDT
ncbi:hypothetical protein PENSTE_c009G06841 [Penicillium steckii]|uniref:Protoporphyrinogen oxidase n=1 Tax=Penicillium steckii TaxID=303698 RepID=A0A1V6TAK1_9EURO|nr:hypothetical protein PENSTE_c009G06841 [Penicillium steckii]